VPICTYGRGAIQFQWMMRQPPFGALDKRVELQTRLNALPGVQIPDVALVKQPSVLLGPLVAETAVTAFLEATDWRSQRHR
jgi:hypothetical protein